MHLKSKHILLFTAAMLFFAVVPCSMVIARTPSPQIATLDLATVLVLHPAMASYDANMKAFKVTRPHQQFFQDKARRATDAAKKIEEHRARIRALESQVTAERQRYIRDEAQRKTEFDKKIINLATEAVRLHRDVYNNKEAENRQKNTARLRSLKLHIDQLYRQIDEENAGMLSDKYTTPMETRQRIAQIVAEIRQYAQLVASSKNITIVLDSGGASFQQLPDPSGIQNKPVDGDLAEVYAKPMLSPITLSSDEASVLGYNNLRRDKALIWHNQRAEILAPYRNELVNTSVLVGGVNITAEVMASILKNYRVDQTVQSILISVIQSGGR